MSASTGETSRLRTTQFKTTDPYWDDEKRRTQINKECVWDCVITLGKAEDVDAGDFSALTKDKLSLLEPSKEFFQAMLFKDRIAFAVIWSLIRGQAGTYLGIDPTSSPENESKAQKLWLNLIDPDTKEAAKKALIAALGDFFPERRIALSTLQSQWEKGRAAVDQETMGLETDLQDYLTADIKGRAQEFREALQKRDLKSLKALEKALDEDAGETSTILPVFSDGPPINGEVSASATSS